MTSKQIVEALMKKNKVNEPMLARALGYKSNASTWKFLHKNQDLKVNTFLKLLDILGMECVVRPKGKYRTKYKLTEGVEE